MENNHPERNDAVFQTYLEPFVDSIRGSVRAPWEEPQRTYGMHKGPTLLWRCYHPNRTLEFFPILPKSEGGKVQLWMIYMHDERGSSRGEESFTQGTRSTCLRLLSSFLRGDSFMESVRPPSRLTCWFQGKIHTINWDEGVPISYQCTQFTASFKNLQEHLEGSCRGLTRLNSLREGESTVLFSETPLLKPSCRSGSEEVTQQRVLEVTALKDQALVPISLRQRCTFNASWPLSHTQGGVSALRNHLYHLKPEELQLSKEYVFDFFIKSSHCFYKHLFPFLEPILEVVKGTKASLTQEKETLTLHIEGVPVSWNIQSLVSSLPACDSSRKYLVTTLNPKKSPRPFVVEGFFIQDRLEAILRTNGVF